MSDPELLLAITADDRLVHVGTPQGLLPHVVDEADEAAFDPQVRVPDWEFYDGTGARYRFTLDADGHKVGFEPLPDQNPDDADRQLLVDRVAASIAMLQVLLDRQIAAQAFGVAGPPRHRLPPLGGELPDVLTVVDALAPAVPGHAPDPGSFLHNLWHQAFG